MAWTTTDRDNVKSAIIELARGQRVTRVTIAGKTTEFAASDINELKEILSLIESDLQADQSPFNKAQFKRPV